jgi:iron complex outermembrane receptor protein
VRIAIDAADRDPTNRAGADYRNPAEPRYGQVNQRFGDPETKPRVLFLNSQYRVNDDIDWYAFANYGQRDTSAAARRTAYNGTARARRCSGRLPAAGEQPLDRHLAGHRPARRSLRLALGRERQLRRKRIQAGPRQHRQPDLGAASPTHFYAGKLKNVQTLLNCDVAKDFPVEAFSGPLTVALGAEYRREI